LNDIASQFFKKGLRAERNGEYESAIDLFKRSLSAFSSDKSGVEEVLLHLGDLLLYTGRVRESVKYLKELVSVNPGDHHYHYLLGFAYSKLMKVREAERELRKALKGDPDEPEYLRSLGWVLCVRDKLEEGEKLLRKAHELDPENPYICTDLAMCLAKMEEMDEAIYMADLARELEPDSPFVEETWNFIKEYAELLKKGQRIGDIFNYFSESEVRVLSLFYDKAEPFYPEYLLEEASRIWLSFRKANKKLIRKPEVWAAALEYTIDMLFMGRGLSQVDLARKYRVSRGSISRSYKELVSTLGDELTVI